MACGRCVDGLYRSRGKNFNTMATLEKRPRGGYRVIFRFGGRRFTRSLGTTNKRAALSALARLEDNLYRAELGTFPIPNNADIPSVLLSDGRKVTPEPVASLISLGELCDEFLKSIPQDSIESGTFKMLKIHAKHLKRILGPSMRIQAVSLSDLQSYVDRRSKEQGRRGAAVSAVTIKKEITTLTAAWKWAVKSKRLTGEIPKDGIRYPKTKQKPPFQTFDQIRRRIARGGLDENAIAELWDSVFLTLDEIQALLVHARDNARHRFIFPMMVCAAHTGARRSELIRSEIDDLDFATKTISVREKKRIRGQISMRSVPMSPFLEMVLTDWIENHPGGNFTFCMDPPGHKELTPTQASSHFNRTLSGSEWEVLPGWHVLRHSFCSNCAGAGVDQRLINEWVGHQTEEMVRRYRHLIPDQQQQAISAVFARTDSFR